MPPQLDPAGQQSRRHMIPSTSFLEEHHFHPRPRASADRLRSPKLTVKTGNNASHNTDTQSAYPAPCVPSSPATVTRSKTRTDHSLSTSEARPRLRNLDPSLRAIRVASIIDKQPGESHSERDSIVGSSPRWSVYENEARARLVEGSVRERAGRYQDSVSERTSQPPGWHSQSPSPHDRWGASGMWSPVRSARPPSPADPPDNSSINTSHATGQTELESGTVAQEYSITERREAKGFRLTLRRFPRHAASDAPRTPSSAAPPLVSSRYDVSHSYGGRLMDIAAEEDDGWTELPSSDGTNSERSIPASAPSVSQGRKPSDGPKVSGGKERVHRSDGLPIRGEDIRKGYYRLYKPTGALLSIRPIYANDRSISSFDVEHVPPPRSAKNYISYIAQRECIRPDGVKMYFTRPGSSPELVSNDVVLNMSDGLQDICGRSTQRPLLLVVEPNSELPSRRYPPQESLFALPFRDLENELPYAYYRLFAVGPSYKAAQRPMPSHYPLWEDDLSLSALSIDYVPPPHRAKDYINYIAELEKIHPSRITLYLSSKSECNETAETQEIKKLGEIVTAETASSTSERNPILVNVRLEVDEDGNVRFGTKSKPLTRSPMGMIVDTLTLGWSR